MLDFKVVDQIEARGRRVLVRGDVDVPLEEGEIEDETRLEWLVRTLRYLLDHGARRVLILGHLGRPGGMREKGLSLRVVVKPLEKLLGEKVGFWEYEKVGGIMKGRGEERGEERVVVLENLRFWDGEEKDESGFAASLAKLGGVYVNEAFAVSHRKQASVVGVPRVVKKRGGKVAGGVRLAKEVETLLGVLGNSQRPLVVVLGGAKAETKLPAMEGLGDLADVFLVGGVVANTFLAAEGKYPKELGRSIVASDQIGEARKLIKMRGEKFEYLGIEGLIHKVVLPRDLVVAWREGEKFWGVEEVDCYGKSGEIFDQTKGVWEVGKKTAQLFSSIISQAGTVVWAGPLGFWEEERFGRSSRGVAEAVVGNRRALKIAGGGDTEAMLTSFGLEKKFDWISSGGGAMLEFLAKRGVLPGLEALGD